MKKLALAMIFTLLFASPAFAEGSDSFPPRFQWQVSEGNWYFYDHFCMHLKNSYTPDGYFVDKDGIWVPDIVLPDMPATPYNDLADITETWVDFTRDMLIDGGLYYEIPDQTLYTWDDNHGTVYKGNLYILKKASSGSYSDLSTFEEWLKVAPTLNNSVIYDNGTYHMMVNTLYMTKDGYFIRFWPGFDPEGFRVD